jgi:AcrR family transcriptional regulator
MKIPYNAVMPRAAPPAASGAPATRQRGRPREFDMDEALDRAVRVFSERGYHGTSIGDLTAAMQLTAGSVYKAFKDKREVFIAAFDRYKGERDARLRLLIGAAHSGREKLRNMLAFYADASSGKLGRQGCLVVGCAAELDTFDEEVARRVTGALGKSEKLLGELIREGQADGSIPPTVDAETAARLMLCVVQGMRLVGKSGRTRAEMAVLVDLALRALD